MSGREEDEEDEDMLHFQEEEEEDEEEEEGDSLQINGNILQALISAAHRRGERTVDMGSLLRHYLAMLNGRAPLDEYDDDDDDDADAGDGKVERPDTSRLVDSDLNIRILMDTGNWYERERETEADDDADDDRAPDSAESDPRVPSVSSRSSTSSSQQQQQQQQRQQQLPQKRLGPMRSRNVYSALKKRKIQTPVLDRCVQKGPMNSSKHGHSKISHISQRYIPNVLVERLGHRSRVFCGKFSLDGTVYTAASQDQHIRLFRVDGNYSWKCFKDIEARHVGWSVLDIDYSPDNRFVCYSTWSPYIQVCNVQGEYELHEQLDMEPDSRRFSLFSMKFSHDNREILGGGCTRNAYLYDVERKQRVLRVEGHTDDINTVSWVSDDANLFLTGSDDCLVKLWDRRMIRDNSGEDEITGQPAEPVSVFVGHQAGITHIDSKRDGNYFLSNGKDQCIKLWDIRKSMPGSQTPQEQKQESMWDYRYGNFNRSSRARQERPKGETSIMTYSGHCVRETLIRSYFSPIATTGQRYIVTGCYTGSMYVYDVLSGETVSVLRFNDATVRDVSWHPHRPILVAASWDGTTATVNAQAGGTRVPPSSDDHFSDNFTRHVDE